MATRTLIQKIEALPPAKRAQIETLVDRIGRTDDASGSGSPDPLIERVRTRRERLLRDHGLYDTSALLRELREDGE